jgi:acid phosphatase type 7
MKKMPSRIFVTLNAIVGIALLVGASPTMAGTLARCPFDNEVTTLTREGATFIRYALGLRGNALVSGTSFSAAQANAVADAITCVSCRPQLDINGDGAFDIHDATIIARVVAGFKGPAITEGLQFGTGSRPSAAAQQQFIHDGCPVNAPVVVLAAGDIAYCPSGAAASNAMQTAAALRRVPGAPVLVLGDLAYFSGTPAEFNDCFDPTWGVEKARLRPAPGNHEYVTPDATGYFGYFGTQAGLAMRGYYSFDVGDWHIVSLNSNIDAVTGSTQELWLRDDLGKTSRSCILAYWHHPVFTSSPRGNNAKMRDIWSTLGEFRTAVILNGHEHNYERFAKQNANGVVDLINGIRQFIVGTGGIGMTPMVTPQTNSEVRNALTFGALKLTLASNSYAWDFVPAVEGVVVDSGTASCR